MARPYGKTKGFGGSPSILGDQYRIKAGKSSRGESIEKAVVENLLFFQSVRDAYNEDFANAERVKYELWGSGSLFTYYLILMKWTPILVRGDQDGVLLAQSSSWMSCYNWSNVQKIGITYDGTLDVTQHLAQVLAPAYLNPDGTSRIYAWPPSISSSNYVQVLPAYEKNLSPAQIFSMCGHLFACYNQEAIKRVKAIAPPESYYGEYYNSESGAWSSAMWPEAPGYRTEYIDNVGIFVPDYTKIDFNLSHALGSGLIGLEIIRPTSLENESKLREYTEWMSFINFITGGEGAMTDGSSAQQVGGNMTFGGLKPGQGAQAGGIAQGIINTVKYGFGIVKRQFGYRRLVYPRVRAFGRQKGGVPTYESYLTQFDKVVKSEGSSYQTSTLGENTYTYAKLGNLYAIRMDRDQYRDFIEPLRSYLEGASQ